MRLFLSALILTLPGAAFAAGSGWGGADTKPVTTETTTTCTGIQVWDPSTKSCVNPRGSSLDDGMLYDAMRELAYAGRIDDAQSVLRLISDQQDDRVLTYWGFTHRKLGRAELAEAYYTRALERNPDNHLARSYRAQGYVTAGRMDAAIAEWREIRDRGGEGSWAEASLREALRTGATFDY